MKCEKPRKGEKKVDNPIGYIYIYIYSNYTRFQVYSGRNQKNTKVFKRSTGLADQIYNCYTYISKDHTHHEYKVVRETARKK